MARTRDYAAEYAARLERERVKAAAEGREFNRTLARGHGPFASGENARATLNRYTRLTTYNQDPKVYRGMVAQVQEHLGYDRTLDLLRKKHADSTQFEHNVGAGMSPTATDGKKGNSEAAHGTRGQARYFTDYQRTMAYLPAPIFWYHGYLG
jgi:hypothetical protein